MGAEPYDYWVSYEPDIQAALDKLRAQVFESGQFRGAEYAPATAEEALEMMDADGTGSILDISRVFLGHHRARSRSLRHRVPG
jgi:hypothetical protein